MMKNIVSWIVVSGLLFLCLFSSPVLAQEKSWHIVSIDSQMQIQKDGTVHVTDTVTFDFTGEFSYVTRSILKRRINRLENLTVRDLNGHVLSNSDLDITDTKESVDVRLNISKKNEQGTWLFDYDVIGALGFFHDHDELYWNVTGNETPVAIDAVTARVVFPQVVSALDVRLDHFTGPVGATTRGGSQSYNESTTTATFSAQSLAPYEGLTLVLGFPKQVVIEPGYLDVSSVPDGAHIYVDGLDTGLLTPATVSLQVGSHTVQLRSTGYYDGLVHNVSAQSAQTDSLQEDLQATLWSRILGLLIILSIVFLPLAALIINGVRWRRHGKDPKIEKTIIAQYNAPSNLSPLHVGFILDNKFQSAHLAGQIVAMAEEGLLTIREEKKNVYTFLKQAKSPERAFDALLLEKMFVGGSTEVSTKDLRNSFYKHLPAIKEAVVTDLIHHGYYDNDPSRAGKGGLVLGILMIGAGIFTAVFLFGIGLFFAGIITVIFSLLMPRRTKKGAEALWHIEGLREYLHTAERFRMKDVSPSEFTRLLPFAMILGVATQWAERFKDIGIMKPDWYNTTTGESWNTLYFATAMSQMTTTVGTSASSRPSSSGGYASGSSGFSGGFSGGGGGGGGFGAG